ncbi:hypothetical protein [Beijerinckia mobilis]|uniref:hypothetical protein n=1 Tax=Beijerinckia mobilis TaxID=231434 RepID=UPI00055889BA|nr:hypothetical protein [Beijerinckia mobilis]
MNQVVRIFWIIGKLVIGTVATLVAGGVVTMTVFYSAFWALLKLPNRDPSALLEFISAALFGLCVGTGFTLWFGVRLLIRLVPDGAD